MVVTVDVCREIEEYEKRGCEIVMSDGFPWNGWLVCDDMHQFITGIYWDYVMCKCRAGDEWACKVLKTIEEEWKQVTGH